MSRPDVLLRLTEGEKTFGERPILRGANFWLAPRERAVLVGPNGAGKSTLFQALVGRIGLDGGSVQRPKDVSLVYLPQDFRPKGSTVYQTAYSITPLYRAEKELEAIPPEHSGSVWNRIRELSYWKGRVGRTLADFGLSQALWETPVEGLSGGEGVRLGLALVFLSGAEVLLLDEPTTHLDLRMRLKLEDLLLSYPGAVALISHDRALVWRVATTVYHLEATTLVRVPGGYATYLAERERVRRTIEKARHEAEKERNRLLEYVPDHRKPGSDRRASQKAQLQTRARRIEAPDPLPPERRWSLEIAAEGTPKLVLEARDLAKAYLLSGGEGEQGSRGEKAGSPLLLNSPAPLHNTRSVIRKATLRIFRGDRIALVGANGAGKTTLLRLLLSRELPDSGERTLGYGVSVAYLDQHFHGLEPGQPLFEQFAARFGEAKAAALLGRVGFRPPHWHDPLTAFSGGERSRAGLALLGALRAGLLVMDEPTNHLEVELLEALERALTDYPGTLLFVSHDRTLVKKVATRFWGLEEGILLEYPSYADAEAAMLGKPATRLSPYGQTPPEAETPLAERDPEQERLELLERLSDVELSDRGRTRLRADLLALEDEIFRQYAHHYYQPAPYRYRLVQQGLEVFADYELDCWHFWSRQGSLQGEVSGGILRVSGKADARVLAAVLRISFELEGLSVVRYGKKTFGRSAYAQNKSKGRQIARGQPAGDLEQKQPHPLKRRKGKSGKSNKSRPGLPSPVV